MTHSGENVTEKPGLVAVYLDQNVLTELRPRRWAEQVTPYSLLWSVLTNSNAAICASHTTIDEILQIPNQMYIDEHIQVLRDAGFYYLHFDEAEYREIADVNQFFEDYLESQQSNSQSGIDKAMQCWDMLIRKSHGLLIEESYTELIGEIFEAFQKLVKSALPTSFRNLLGPVLDIERSTVELKVQTWIDDNPEVLQEAGNIERLREQALKLGDLTDIPVERVVTTILNNIGFSEKNIDNLIDYPNSPNRNPQDHKLAIAFFILNFSGYRADDFRRVNKKSDRFRSSQNDFRHLCHAKYANFLVTDDLRFLDKAKAIYSWAGISTKVVTTRDFLILCIPKEIYESQ